MKTLTTWALAGALAASLALNLHQATRDRDEAPPLLDADAAVDELCLTEKQCNLLRDACVASGDDRDEIGRSLQAKGQEIIEVVTLRGGIDEVRAFALADEMGRLQAAYLKSRIHAIQQVRETLTDEQLELLRAAITR